MATEDAKNLIRGAGTGEMTGCGANAYTPVWFELFGDCVDAGQTRREADFLARNLPRPGFDRLLDIACGTGRHAALLAGRGYLLTCIDINPRALAAARARLGAAARVLKLDMRSLEQLPGDFDAALLLWQSFGYFDEDTNAQVLGQIARKLRPGGRLVLDIYDRRFFESRSGERTHHPRGRRVIERKSMSGNRLLVQLEYDDGTCDAFDWQLFAPGEIIALAASARLECLLQCSEFDEATAPDGQRPRVQYIFQRPTAG